MYIEVLVYYYYLKEAQALTIKNWSLDNGPSCIGQGTLEDCF